MNIAIVTNLSAGIGLFRDSELLTAFLKERNHAVFPLQFDDLDQAQAMKSGSTAIDLTIFLEVIPREFLGIAPVNWLFANVEWMTPDKIVTAERYIDRIFAKTREAKRILDPLFHGNVVYTGFLTRDQYLPDVVRKRQFLHIGGNSSLRGTKTLIDAWRWKKNGAGLDIPLIVVSTTVGDLDLPENVRLISERMTDEDLQILQNESMFHIYPSATEGFGHALHEARSVNALLMTTGSPPMSEAPRLGTYFFEGKKYGTYNLADLYEVDALEVFKGVEFVKEPGAIPISSRDDFFKGNRRFALLFDRQLDNEVKPLTPIRTRHSKGKRERIAFLGNFIPEDSTENMVKWALERLEYPVTAIQENESSLQQLQEDMDFHDLFIWIHTPRYLGISNDGMLKFLAHLKDEGIPTVSMHLDKFWGLPEREAQIGVEPFWKTEFVFTADGSRQNQFRERGVNHYYMRPAMSEVYIHPGVPRGTFLCDVGFVGAKGYHKEYPFRRELVDFLETRYGDKFHHVTSLRGHGLNDFYASCKVSVGDCIFAGTPNYYSDRAPETCGRHGFLIHPRVEGLEIPLATYVPQSTESLGEAIDWWLGHSAKRMEVRGLATAHVAENDTWTIRMRQILSIVLETGEQPQ
jgi:hypothetical protein